MLLRDILESKGDSDVLTISPSSTLSDVVEKMVAHNCGSLVVCDDDQMVGIISERDVLRTVANRDARLDQILVHERMTRNVITGSPDDNISAVMGLMTKHRIRHLPVLRGNALAGLISIGDIVKAQHHNLERENHLLMAYIQS